MSPKSKILTVLCLSLLYSYLFYNQELGLNFLVFEFSILALLIYFKQLNFKNNKIQFALVGFCISILSFIWNYSVFALVVNVIFAIYLIGVISYPQVKNHFYGIIIGLYSMSLSLIELFKNISLSAKSSNRFLQNIWRTKIYLIPIIISIIFIAIYRNSSTYFNSIINTIEKYTIDNIPNLFEHIDGQWLLLFMVGVIYSGFVFLRSRHNDLVNYDLNSSDHIIRTKKSFFFDYKPNALQTEAKLGVLLLIVLNLMLMILNSIDIYWVWFNFTWNGTILKQFVHEGTYLLIFSVLLSIAIVLYYFRANQNFNPKINSLKRLSIMWIAQNIILCISVGIRNYWYIDYFNLAYKRIGVIIFLIITIYGLYTVYLKVKSKKSFSYLLSKNTLSILVILLFFSLFNWDIIIAKYNFNNAHKAYLHLEYMHSLGNKAIPYIDKPIEEINNLKIQQKLLFKFDTNYMSAEEYINKIALKKSEFLRVDENKDWRSWNYAEYNARKLLKN